MLDSSWIVPGVSLMSACVIAVGNYIVQRWRYKLDRVGLAIDQICSEINNTSEIATKYWYFERTKEGGVIEADLVGRQMRIQATIFALDMLDPQLDVNDLDAALARFYETITGGSFQEANRKADPKRVREIHGQAAEINRRLRSALANRMNSIWIRPRARPNSHILSNTHP